MRKSTLLRYAYFGQVVPGSCFLGVFKVFHCDTFMYLLQIDTVPNNSFRKIEIKVVFSPAIFIPERASKAALTWWVMTVVINIQNMWRKHLLFIGCGPEEFSVAVDTLPGQVSAIVPKSVFTFGLKTLMLPSKHICQGIESYRVSWKEGIWTIYNFTSRNQSFQISNALLSSDSMGISGIMLLWDNSRHLPVQF